MKRKLARNLFVVCCLSLMVAVILWVPISNLEAGEDTSSSKIYEHTLGDIRVAAISYWSALEENPEDSKVYLIDGITAASLVRLYGGPTTSEAKVWLDELFESAEELLAIFVRSESLTSNDWVWILQPKGVYVPYGDTPGGLAFELIEQNFNCDDKANEIGEIQQGGDWPVCRCIWNQCANGCGTCEGETGSFPGEKDSIPIEEFIPSEPVPWRVELPIW